MRKGCMDMIYGAVLVGRFHSSLYSNSWCMDCSVGQGSGILTAAKINLEARSNQVAKSIHVGFIWEGPWQK